jgi:hypothetical protein
MVMNANAALATLAFRAITLVRDVIHVTRLEISVLKNNFVTSKDHLPNKEDLPRLICIGMAIAHDPFAVYPYDYDIDTYYYQCQVCGAKFERERIE